MNKQKMAKYKSEFIPIRSISINSCFQGRRYRTAEFRKWQEAVIYSLPKKKLSGKNLFVSITLYFKHPLKMDADNFIKGLIDCLVAREIIKDDRYIFDLQIKKRQNDEEGFEIFVSEV